MNGLPFIVVCPRWREDGDWGVWTTLTHFRMVIGLPISIDILTKVGVGKGLRKCSCGTDLVIAFGPEFGILLSEGKL